MPEPPAQTIALERRPPSDAEVLELVRGRVLRGYDRARLPLELENELGIESAVVERALARLADEERRGNRRWGWRLAGGLGGLVAGGVVLDHFVGLSRSLGLGLFALMMLALAGMFGWLAQRRPRL